MKTQRLLSFFLFFFALLIFQNCSLDKTETSADTSTITLKDNNNSFDKQVVLPPMQNVDVAFNNFELNPQSSKIFTLPSGSSIEIPANAFVDRKGLPVTTPVNVKYREFVSAADIIASGIPMKASQNGESGDMESAGMFELQASTNNTEVYIAEGKDITINMATNVGGNDFDFWYFDTDKGNWDNLGQSTPTPNNKKSEVKKVLASMPILTTPNKPIAFDYKKPVLNFDINVDEYPELKEMDAVFWQYTGKGKNPESAKWIFEEEWDYANVEKSDTPNEFQLELKKGTKSFKTYVCPSQKGENFDNAMAEYNSKMKDYKDNSVSLNQKKEFYRQQKDFIRSVSVGNTGIFNYDILWKNPDNILVDANFDFGKNVPVSQSKVNVYLICDSGRRVVAFPPKDWHKFGFDPSKDNQIVAILPNNKIATFNQDDFTEQQGLLQSSKGGQYNFEMTVKTNEINSVNDLNQILAINQDLDSSEASI